MRKPAAAACLAHDSSARFQVKGGKEMFSCKEIKLSVTPRREQGRKIISAFDFALL